MFFGGFWRGGRFFVRGLRASWKWSIFVRGRFRVGGRRFILASYPFFCMILLEMKPIAMSFPFASSIFLRIYSKKHLFYMILFFLNIN